MNRRLLVLYTVQLGKVPRIWYFLGRINVSCEIRLLFLMFAHSSGIWCLFKQFLNQHTWLGKPPFFWLQCQTWTIYCYIEWNSKKLKTRFNKKLLQHQWMSRIDKPACLRFWQNTILTRQCCLVEDHMNFEQKQKVEIIQLSVWRPKRLMRNWAGVKKIKILSPTMSLSFSRLLWQAVSQVGDRKSQISWATKSPVLDIFFR